MNILLQLKPGLWVPADQIVKMEISGGILAVHTKADSVHSVRGCDIPPNKTLQEYAEALVSKVNHSLGVMREGPRGHIQD